MGLDMLMRLRKPNEVVVALLNEGQYLKAIDFAKDNGV